VCSSYAANTALSFGKVAANEQEFMIQGKGALFLDAGGFTQLLHHQAPAGWIIAAMTYGTVKTDLHNWVNGVASIQSVTTSGSPSDPQNLGRVVRVGSRYGLQFYTGDIAEVLLFNRAVSAAVVAEVTAYLNKQYAVF
jgi:hypothetical protein